jgi:uncharacterized protein YodC (DUF2158 family)
MSIIRNVRLQITACVIVCCCSGGLAVRRAAAWSYVLGVKEDAWLRHGPMCLVWGKMLDSGMVLCVWCEWRCLTQAWSYVFGVKENAWLRHGPMCLVWRKMPDSGMVLCVWCEGRCLTQESSFTPSTQYHAAALLTAKPPLQQHTITHVVICRLTLLMMGKCLSGSCWADLEDQ